MKKAVLCTIVFAFLSLSALAQQPAKGGVNPEKVRTLLKMTGAEENVRLMIDGLLKQTQENVHQAFNRNPNHLPPEAMMKEIDAVVAKFFGDVLPANELLAEIYPIYERNFTNEDIDALIAFYSSPAGKRFAEKSPIIMRESMEAGKAFAEKRVAAHQNEFEAQLMEIVKKYQALEEKNGK